MSAALRAELEAALLDGNVRAFLRVIRHCEGTADGDGYRRLFAGELVDDLRDHPRKAVTARLGGRPITSTAAGAYQFLARTWDECARALDLPGFDPTSQDLAAVFLIRRRRALQLVIAGRLQDALAACAREWASLPGSPYGQPTKSEAECLRVYLAANGLLEPQPAPQAGAPTEVPAPTPPAEVPPIESPVRAPPPATPPEGEPAMAPFLAAALPALIARIPQLGQLFGSQSDVSQRNVKTAELAVQIVSDALGARNAQEAVEIVSSDPKAAQAAGAALSERWFDLTKASGADTPGARAFVAQAGRSNPEVWGIVRHVTYAALSFLLLANLIAVAAWGLAMWRSQGVESATQILVQVIAADILAATSAISFWLGSSFGSRQKDEQQASAPR